MENIDVCNKCGKKIKDEELYCDECLADIEIKQYEMQIEM